MKDHENKSMDSSKRNDSCNGLIYFNPDCDQRLENVLKEMITFCFTRRLNVGTVPCLFFKILFLLAVKGNKNVSRKQLPLLPVSL